MSTFTTTLRRSRDSVARKTRDIPPPPSSRSNVYVVPNDCCNHERRSSVAGELSEEPTSENVLRRRSAHQHLFPASRSRAHSWRPRMLFVGSVSSLAPVRLTGLGGYGGRPHRDNAG